MNLYQWVMRHFWWKITSVIVATILWGTVRWDMIERSQDEAQGRGPMVTFVHEAVPVLLLKEASEAATFVLTPSVVSVKVRANSSVLEEMDVSEIRVVADLINRPNTNSFRVPLDISVSDEIQVEFFEPREVAVQVEEPRLGDP